MITINSDSGLSFFALDRLNSPVGLETFTCSVLEYNEWLIKEAFQSQDDLMAATYLLHERSTGEIASYMALLADAIKLKDDEKEHHSLIHYPFKTVLAMKIGKLAVSNRFKSQYRGIGSYMIQLAIEIADRSNQTNFSCRFITVDADIEHNPGVKAFYKKNGFIENEDKSLKGKKTASMRKDILKLL